jgi:hypothetical protein
MNMKNCVFLLFLCAATSFTPPLPLRLSYRTSKMTLKCGSPFDDGGVFSGFFCLRSPNEVQHIWKDVTLASIEATKATSLITVACLHYAYACFLRIKCERNKQRIAALRKRKKTRYATIMEEMKK